MWPMACRGNSPLLNERYLWFSVKFVRLGFLALMTLPCLMVLALFMSDESDTWTKHIGFLHSREQQLQGHNWSFHLQHNSDEGDQI